MTGAERKRLWRQRNPERSREAERQRAQARRYGWWGTLELGKKPRLCASSASYWKHEHSSARYMQRLWYPTVGAGAHRLAKEARGEAIKQHYAMRLAELDAKLDAEWAALEARFGVRLQKPA
jgi:hypothetical protein